jgi:hypothetical protein
MYCQVPKYPRRQELTSATARHQPPPCPEYIRARTTTGHSAAMAALRSAHVRTDGGSPSDRCRRSRCLLRVTMERRQRGLPAARGTRRQARSYVRRCACLHCTQQRHEPDHATHRKLGGRICSARTSRTLCPFFFQRDKFLDSVDRSVQDTYVWCMISD